MSAVTEAGRCQLLSVIYFFLLLLLLFAHIMICEKLKEKRKTERRRKKIAKKSEYSVPLSLLRKVNHICLSIFVFLVLVAISEKERNRENARAPTLSIYEWIVYHTCVYMHARKNWPGLLAFDEQQVVLEWARMWRGQQGGRVSTFFRSVDRHTLLDNRYYIA